MKFNWAKWSAIAEILSALAIVITLLYLAMQTRYVAEQTELATEQIRQNNEALSVQARLTREAMARNTSTRALNNIELARAIVRARAGEELSELEEFLLDQVNTSVLIEQMQLYEQVQDGLLSPESIPTPIWRTGFRDELPRMRETWESRKAVLPPDFVKWYQENVTQ